MKTQLTQEEVSTLQTEHQEMFVALLEAVSALDRIDELLLEQTNSPRECALGEVSRGLAVICRVAARHRDSVYRHTISRLESRGS
jgi:hypothetical protein